MKTPLKRKRESKKLMQEELAVKTGIPVRTYQRYESKERVPDVHIALRLAKRLEIKTLDEFIAVFGEQ